MSAATLGEPLTRSVEDYLKAIYRLSPGGRTAATRLPQPGATSGGAGPSRPLARGRATSAGTLTGFCANHHRGKHQAPGWHYDLSSDGTLTVRTPQRPDPSTAPPPY